MSGDGDVKARLNYGHDVGVRPWAYLRELREGDPHATAFGPPGGSAHPSVRVRNARATNPRLDVQGFELVEAPTRLGTDEFYDDEAVRSRYYPEVEQCVKEATGAARVVVFHHQVRNGARAGADGVEGYAAGVHADADRLSAEAIFERHRGADVKQGRFLYLNAWRNIDSEPIERDGLAVLDAGSVVAPDDFIAADIHLEHYSSTQYKLDDRNAARHRWYHFPSMERDEVLLFKQWDSDPLRAGRQCFHTAFQAIGADGAAARPRQSIEARCLLFFPDHVPNTIPPPAAGAGGGAEAAVQTVLAALRGASSWPPQARAWLASEVAKGDPATIAGIMLADSTGQMGFARLSDAARAAALQRLVSPGADLIGVARRGLGAPAKSGGGGGMRQAALLAAAFGAGLAARSLLGR